MEVPKDCSFFESNFSPFQQRKMSKSFTTYIGIDVSKSELSIAIPSSTPETPLTQKVGKKKGGLYQNHIVKNQMETLEAWFSKQDLKSSHFIFEATGTYSDKLAQTLSKWGATYSIVNPRQSKAWAVATNAKNKTDQQDAQNLSDYGAKNKPKPHQLPSPAAQKRHQAVSAQRAFKKHHQSIQNQIHALEQLEQPNPIVLKAFQDTLESLQIQIQALQQAIAPPQDEPKLVQTVQLIASIRGIGTDTAEKITALCGDLTQFQSAKTFAAFIGVSPCLQQSGTCLNKASIASQGIPELKVALFNCARSAIQHNPVCKAFYRKLVDVKGKKKMVALVAVMHKLARVIWGIVHSGVPFQIDF